MGKFVCGAGFRFFENMIFLERILTPNCNNWKVYGGKKGKDRRGERKTTVKVKNGFKIGFVRNHPHIQAVTIARTYRFLVIFSATLTN